MAEYDERSLDDLTEEPSQHKLDELRSKGQVAQSRELTATAVYLGIVLCIYFFSQKFYTDYTGLMKEIFSKDLLQRITSNESNVFSEIIDKCAKFAFLTFIPIGLTGMVLGIVGSVAQTGFVMSTDVINPDFSRVNPVQGFLRLLSFKSLTEGFKSIVKLIVVLTAVYGVLKSEILSVPDTIAYGLPEIMRYMSSISIKVLALVGFMLLLSSGLDYWIQWRRFRKQARMTKQESKQEHREREGDPQIKARIRSIQRETARKRMMKSVPKADVVITNPTHFAIAIIYNPEENFAPKVIAKGADFLAQKIKAVAKENNIPMVENVALARTLYKHVKVGQLIPRSLYQAVAEVLAYVYKIRGKRPKLDSSADVKQDLNSTL